MRPKRELVRLVRSPDGTISIDAGGKVPGRGAYVCANPECLKKAIKTNALSRTLETRVPDELYDTLYERLNERRGES